MPRLLSTTAIQLEFADLLTRTYPPRENLSRSSGCHLSTIIRHMAVVNDILKPGEQVEDDMPLRMFLGMAWEEAAATLYPDMVWQPGEVEKDGVWGTCDGLSYEEVGYGSDADGDTVGCVDEFKLTWKSSSRLIMEEWMWLQQGAGYCVMHGVRHVKFHVCWVNGDYKQERDPKYIRYLVEWSERELEAVWKHMLAVKKELGL